MPRISQQRQVRGVKDYRCQGAFVSQVQQKTAIRRNASDENSVETAL